MKRSYPVYCTLLILSAWLAVQTAEAQTPAWPLSLTDADKNLVTLERPPQRIVSIMPSCTELLYAIGAEAALAAVTNYCDYPADALNKPKVGDLFSLSLERIVAMKPDLVVGTKDNPAEIIEGLRAMRTPVFIDDPQTVDQVIGSIRTFGMLTGHALKADSVASGIERRLKAVSAVVARIPPDRHPTVFVGSPLNNEHWTPGPGTFTTDLIIRAGGKNMADDLKPRTWGVYTLEQILARNPKWIVTSEEKDVEAAALKSRILSRARATAGWKDIQAIKTGRIVVLTGEWLFRPGPRVILAIEALAKAFHGEQVAR